MEKPYLPKREGPILRSTARKEREAIERMVEQFKNDELPVSAPRCKWMCVKVKSSPKDSDYWVVRPDYTTVVGAEKTIADDD